MLPPEIFKLWIHSREEDKEDNLVYRPEGYQLPLARGRDRFEIKESGEFIWYGIGPDDRGKKAAGHWTIEVSNSIRIIFEDKSLESFVINIISCTDKIFIIKKFPE